MIYSNTKVDHGINCCSSLIDEQKCYRWMRNAIIPTIVLGIMTSLLLGYYVTPTSGYISAVIFGTLTCIEFVCAMKSRYKPHINPSRDGIERDQKEKADGTQQKPDQVQTVWTMKAAEIRAIEARMRPGSFCDEGFLDRTQSLRQCCEQDAKVLRELNITHQQISDRLTTLMKKYDRMREIRDISQDSEVVIDQNWKVKILSGTKGCQECPFDPENCHGPGNKVYQVENIKTGKKISVSDMHPHLVGKHHFFEGNISYRVDPRLLCEVLELKPNQDYRPPYEIYQEWQSFSSGPIGSVLAPKEDEIKQKASETYKHENVTGYGVVEGERISLYFFSHENHDFQVKQLKIDNIDIQLDRFRVNCFYEYVLRQRKVIVLSADELTTVN